MRTPCCQTCLAFILKFLNFLQAFIGVSIIVYSCYMLNQWQHHRHEIPPTNDVINALNFASDGNVLSISFRSLPAPWFIYAFMGIGILLCCITFIGHIAAEAINGCCLCFYAILSTMFVLLETGLVAFIAIDHHWEKVQPLFIFSISPSPASYFTFLLLVFFILHSRSFPGDIKFFQDLPFDPTGELHRFRTLIQDNMDVFEWVGIAIIVIQVLSLLSTIILRSLVSGQRIDDDIEGDYSFRSNTREPLLNPFSSQASGSARGDSDIWSSRMREKYGLNSGDGKLNSLNHNPSTDVKL